MFNLCMNSCRDLQSHVPLYILIYLRKISYLIKKMGQSFKVIIYTSPVFQKGYKIQNFIHIILIKQQDMISFIPENATESKFSNLRALFRSTTSITYTDHCQLPNTLLHDRAQPVGTSPQIHLVPIFLMTVLNNLIKYLSHKLTSFYKG